MEEEDFYEIWEEVGFGESPSEEPVWFEFIVSEELGGWGVVMTYDESFENFYLWTGYDIC